MSNKYAGDGLFIGSGYNINHSFSLIVKGITMSHIHSVTDSFYVLLSDKLYELVRSEFSSPTNEVIINCLSAHTLNNISHKFPTPSIRFTDRYGMVWMVSKMIDDLSFTLYYSEVIVMPNELTIIKG